MKNVYIFITYALYTIGGGQVYVRNKTLFLESKGWTVILISMKAGVVLIEEFKNRKLFIFKTLKYSPSELFLFAQNNIVGDLYKTIINEIKEKDLTRCNSVIVESHTLTLSLWGELLAEKMRCKHIVFLLEEKFRGLTKTQLEYLDFKHKRKELVGIHKSILPEIFSGYKCVKDNEGYFFKAGGFENIFKDYSHPTLTSFDRLDINICTISRLGKDYLETLIKEISVFLTLFPNLHVLLLIVGSGDRKHHLKLRKEASRCRNLTLIMHESVFPIPRSLLKKIDLFVSVAGSAIATAREGALTLSLDVNTHRVMGVLGMDTDDWNYASDSSSTLPLNMVLKKMFIDNNIKDYKIKKKVFNSFDLQNNYESQLDFVYQSISSNKYYNNIVLYKRKFIIKYIRYIYINIKYVINRFHL